MRTVVLVPRREDGGFRDDLWAWCRDTWWADLGLPIYEGHHDEGPFCRSAAINTAARYADGLIGDRPWDVAVILDADTIVDHAAVASAALLAERSGQITWAFSRWAGLSSEGSALVRAGYDGGWDEHVAVEILHSASSCLAVPRRLWDRVGGFDEGFVGWGYEDAAMSLACQAIGGGSHRIPGTAWHLWHPPAEGTGDSTHPLWIANRDRCQAYVDAGWDDYVAMETLLRDLGLWERFG